MTLTLTRMKYIRTNMLCLQDENINAHTQSKMCFICSTIEPEIFHTQKELRRRGEMDNDVIDEDKC